MLRDLARHVISFYQCKHIQSHWHPTVHLEWNVSDVSISTVPMYGPAQCVATHHQAQYRPTSGPYTYGTGTGRINIKLDTMSRNTKASMTHNTTSILKVSLISTMPVVFPWHFIQQSTSTDAVIGGAPIIMGFYCSLMFIVCCTCK